MPRIHLNFKSSRKSVITLVVMFASACLIVNQSLVLAHDITHENYEHHEQNEICDVLAWFSANKDCIDSNKITLSSSVDQEQIVIWLGPINDTQIVRNQRARSPPLLIS